MKKAIFLDFLQRIHLNGRVDTIRLESKGDSLISGFTSQERDMVGFIKLKAFKDFPENMYGINNLSQLIKFVNVFEDEIQLHINEYQHKATAIHLSDTVWAATFALTELAIIPKAPIPKEMPQFNVTLDITKEFIDHYLKQISVLPVTKFKLQYEELGASKLIFVMGEDEGINSHRIEFAFPCSEGTSIPQTNYSAEVLRDILDKNKSFETGVFAVSDQGMIKITFKKQNLLTEYYLIEKQ